MERANAMAYRTDSGGFRHSCEVEAAEDLAEFLDHQRHGVEATRNLSEFLF